MHAATRRMAERPTTSWPVPARIDQRCSPSRPCPPTSRQPSPRPASSSTSRPPLHRLTSRRLVSRLSLPRASPQVAQPASRAPRTSPSAAPGQPSPCLVLRGHNRRRGLRAARLRRYACVGQLTWSSRQSALRPARRSLARATGALAGRSRGRVRRRSDAGDRRPVGINGPTESSRQPVALGSAAKMHRRRLPYPDHPRRGCRFLRERCRCVRARWKWDQAG